MDQDDPWMGFILSAVFKICSTQHRLKFYTPSQLFVGRYVILPIEHIAYWKLISHSNQTYINCEYIRKNTSIVDYE